MQHAHKVLGVKANADITEIKRAFREKAKLLHPDVAGGIVGAEEQFVDLKLAYEQMLKRRKNPPKPHSSATTNGAQGKPHQPPPPPPKPEPQPEPKASPQTPSAPPNQPKLWDQGLWSGSLGKAAKNLADGLSGLGSITKHRTSQFKLKISFAEAARGALKKVRLSNGRPIEVEIPAGTAEGETLVIRLPEDLAREEKFARTIHVTIAYHPHETWRRDGDDVYLTLPVTVPEAVFGAKIEIPSLDGPLLLTVPPGSNAQTKIRLKGKGWPKDDDPKGGFGDFFVVLKIVLPPKQDESFKRAIAEWAKIGRYDVR